MNTDSPSEFKSSRHILQTHHLSQATSWKTPQQHKRPSQSSALCCLGQSIQLSQKATQEAGGLWRPVFPERSLCPADSGAAGAPPAAVSWPPAGNLGPTCSLPPSPPPSPRPWPHGSLVLPVAAPRMLMFESKQREVSAENQLQGARDAQQRLVLGPVMRV